MTEVNTKQSSVLEDPVKTPEVSMTARDIFTARYKNCVTFTEPYLVA